MKQEALQCSVERLRELLSYDPATGLFRWRVRRSFTANVGSIAGSLTQKGYVVIYIDGVGYKAHRIAWAMQTGNWPTNQIDHKNRIKNDNRWRNLREATNRQNCANTGLRSDNKTGVKGVRYCNVKKRWIASLGRNGRNTTLGTFKTKAEAVRVRRSAAEQEFGEYASRT